MWCNRSYVINIVQFHPNPNLNLTQDIYIYTIHTHVDM